MYMRIWSILILVALLGAVAACSSGAEQPAGSVRPSSVTAPQAPVLPSPADGTAATDAGSSTGFDPAFRALSPRDRLRHVVSVMHGEGALLVTRTGEEANTTVNDLEATDVRVRLDDCALVEPCRKGSEIVLREMRLMGDPPRLALGQQAMVFVGPVNIGASSFGGGDTAERVAVHGSSVIAVEGGSVRYGGEKFTTEAVLDLVSEHLPWPDPAAPTAAGSPS